MAKKKKKRDFGALFEECCWIFDAEGDIWIMPLPDKAPAIQGALVRGASETEEDRNALIETLETIKGKYEEVEHLVDPIIERLKTAPSERK